MNYKCLWLPSSLFWERANTHTHRLLYKVGLRPLPTPASLQGVFRDLCCCTGVIFVNAHARSLSLSPVGTLMSNLFWLVLFCVWVYRSSHLFDLRFYLAAVKSAGRVFMSSADALASQRWRSPSYFCSYRKRQKISKN